MGGAASNSDRNSNGSGKTFFGHPRGLATLFFTEMWERFSYYGMRALLILFMTDTTRGGMGWGVEHSSAIYGLYTFSVYVLSLPGGWIADRLIGKKKAVLWGGIIIALGHYTLAVPSVTTYFAGLALVALGTGLLKPNVSAVVGDLYDDQEDARRDAAFSIFYMGINIGAVLGPTLCSLAGEHVSWHLGFGLAGVGMTAAVVQYVLGQKHLGAAGDLTSAALAKRDEAHRILIGALVATALLGALVWWLFRTGRVTLVQFADWTGVILLALVVAYFLFTLIVTCESTLERRRVGAIFFLFVGAALFWSGFEQAGSSMNLFAEEFTDRTVIQGVRWLDPIPAGWLQNVNPVFIILLAPVFGSLWVKLGSRNPSVGLKFAMGLMLLGVGFLVLAWGARYTDAGRVGMQWLVVTYFFHTVGELCLSPVGLSYTTKLAPERIVSQMMGIWFVGAAIGNLIAGRVAGFLEDMPPATLFRSVAIYAIASGLVFLMLWPLIKWLAKAADE
jgi:POT family proton-dependent oligopeptide transporter